MTACYADAPVCDDACVCLKVDSNRMTLVFFTLSGLDLLGTLNKKISQEQKKEIIDWIYGLQVVVPKPPGAGAGHHNGHQSGFRGATYMGACHDPSCEPHGVIPYDGGHLAMSYTALASLAILGDDFSRVRRRDMALALQAYQKEDGSFMCAEDGEVDMRFTYCACCIAYFLNDWSGIDIPRAADYIAKSQGYDGGVAQGPGLESHGSFAFCGVASLALMGKIDEVLSPLKKEKLLKWLLMRQESGFCGRPHKPVDTCYSFWVGSTIKLLKGSRFVNKEENRAFLMKTQHPHEGGFSKWVDVMADPLHTYMAISGLAINGEPGIALVHPALNISVRATLQLPYERREDVMLDDAAPAQRGVDGGTRAWSALLGTTPQLCTLLLIGGAVHKYGKIENETWRTALSSGLAIGGVALAWRLAKGE